MANDMLMTLDLATHVGWTVGRIAARMPKFGTHTLPSTGPDIGLFIAAYDDWLRRMISAHSPYLIVFEQPTLSANTNIMTLRKLYGLVSHTEYVCRAKVTVREANPSQIKKWWTGNGRAEKSEMIAVARGNGFDVATDDEADALACRYFAIEKMFPKHSGMVLPGVQCD